MTNISDDDPIYTIEDMRKERAETIEEVLEIIEKERKRYSPHQPSGAWACDNIRLAVVALKGGDEE